MIEQTAIGGGGKAIAPRGQRYRATLLVVVSLSTYTGIPLLAGGGLLVPSFPTIVLAPILFLAVFPNISKADELFILKLVFVLLLSIAFSPGYEYVGEKFFGLIQCGMAIAVAVLLVRLMRQMQHESLERTLLVLWCLIIAGSMLEITGLTRDVSDSFRDWAYGGAYTIYAGELRDINMVGWPRPKLFSIEPSHVTKFFIAAVNAWLLVRVSWGKVAVVIGATLVMLVIMGSPMLIVSAAITVAIVLWERLVSRRTKLTMVLATLLIVALFGIYYGGTAYTGVASRLSNIESVPTRNQTLGSEEQRIVYPYMVLANTWLRWPIFGTGIGGKEVLFENSTFRLRTADDAVGNNALAEMGIYLGLVGVALFVYVLLRQAHQTGVNRLGLAVIIFAMFSQLMGGVVTFRYWGFIALLWGALAVSDAKLNDDMA